MENFDAAIIGAGAAGMMAAIFAAKNGGKIVLLEKNNELGKKVLITGNGRCNITNAEFDLKLLTKAFGRQGKFLFPAFNLFSPKDAIDFFESRGLKTKIEKGNKVFPKSDKAPDVIKVLKNELGKLKVKIIFNAKVEKFILEKNKIEKIIYNKNLEILADKFIIATGGKSYAQTGSRGDGYLWAKSLGHKIVPLLPGIVPIKIKEQWVKDLSGLDLKNAEIKISGSKKANEKAFGQMLFTHFGISGPAVLNISNIVGKHLQKGEVKLAVDLMTDIGIEALDKKLQNYFQENKNKSLKNSLDDFFPKRLADAILNLAKIDPEKKSRNITKKERTNLVKLIKSLEMTATGLMGFEMATITTGGVDLSEIDPKTMKSKLIKNLSFCGEILAVHGPTGGFNLQQAWSTGALAGHVARERRGGSDTPLGCYVSFENDN